MNEVRRLKFVKLREELMALTGDHVKSMILDRFLYFKDSGKLAGGWIYKSAKELAEVDMFGVAHRTTVCRRLSDLVGDGYLESRSNPSNPRDNTLQYRVDLERLVEDLGKIGYHLEGYTTAPTPVQAAHPPVHSAHPPVQAAQTLPEKTTEKTNNNPPAPTRDPGGGPAETPAKISGTTEKPVEYRSGESVDYTEVSVIPPGCPDPKGRAPIKPNERMDYQMMFVSAWRRYTRETWRNSEANRDFFEWVRAYWTEKEIVEALESVAQKSPRDPRGYFTAILKNMADPKETRPRKYKDTQGQYGRESVFTDEQAEIIAAKIAEERAAEEAEWSSMAEASASPEDQDEVERQMEASRQAFRRMTQPTKIGPGQKWETWDAG